jgi:site-specific recombinase XerD
MYCSRTRKFLALHPEAMKLDEAAARSLIDSYIEGATTNSSKEVLATAVRYYWHYRFGKPYFPRYRQRDFPPNDSIDKEVEAFRSHLAATGSLAEVTITGHVRGIRHFLYTEFGASAFLRERVSVEAVHDYLSYLTPQLSLSTKSCLASDIRSYANFLVEKGHEDTARPITMLPLSFNSRRSVKIPGRMKDADLRILIDSLDPSCERGARDLALILLMGNLGLRASDAAYLELDDIDWAAGELVVRNSKSVTPRRLPLDADSGSAIERYASRFRPRIDSRRIFLTAGRERGEGPLSSAQAGRAVKLVAEKAGISGYRGTHTLRRAVATNMVAAGVAIKIVADVLGHESVFTTMGYLRLDLDSLKEAAAEWPEGEVSHG